MKKHSALLIRKKLKKKELYEERIIKIKIVMAILIVSIIKILKKKY